MVEKIKIPHTDRAICAVCGGENPSYQGWRPEKNRGSWLWACDGCWDIIQTAYDEQRNRTAHDIAARDYAGQRGGAYLEKLGKTDLAELSLEEWEKFLDTLFRAKQSELRRLHSPSAPLL